MQPPQPKDGRLTLEVAGGEVAAVLKFEGSATRETTLKAVAQLKNVLESGRFFEMPACWWTLKSWASTPDAINAALVTNTVGFWHTASSDLLPTMALPALVDTHYRDLAVNHGCKTSVLFFKHCPDHSRVLSHAWCADGLRLAEEEAAGAFRLAQYGPLNSLSTRVNEVLLRVLL
jgi:hypothetical protein